ncbi:DUF29 domain-containing protein [Sphingomonas bacterium]|uniref:DUF29 domain-containing protein n=1 Tax=Sphingomonas bacterium TaxID=1895847 RepID=UPI001577718B|nr:DUF29 domain-containing protein [Sphingomonas bacterium]
MAERDPRIGPGRQAASYEADYSAWIDAQAALLQAGRFGELDIVNLVDEVESLGRSAFYSFASAIEIVIVHMLKWDTQPIKRTPSWVASIAEHRRRIEQSFEDNPSYRSRIDEAVTRAWRTANAKAAGETNLPLTAFPSENPYDWAAITTRPHELPVPARRNRKNL